jgi:hypothetical protein
VFLLLLLLYGAVADAPVVGVEEVEATAICPLSIDFLEEAVDTD